tara:strand:+ start:418 stop:732 length:315 start_codon:yes stop_codon:yes gene_type:complete
MKKIILLMLMLSPFAKADMDYVCNIVLNDFLDLLTDSGEMATMIKSKGCERNNILFLTLLENSELNLNLQIASALWCRHDRNEKVVANTLRCVLYNTKPRKYLR